MSYQFFDANGSILTADSNVVGGAHQPIVQVSSIIGTIPVTFTGSPSVSGTVGASVLGTVPVTQSGAWNAAVTQSGAWTTSVVGGVSVLGGNVGVTQLGAWTTSVVGTVSVAGGTISITPASVSGVGVFNTNNVGNGSVITVFQNSSLIVFQGGTWATSTVGVAPPHSVSGVGIFNVNNTGNGSVLTLSQGSVITVSKDSSILSVPVGSTIAVIQAASIAGTYTEDSAHATNDRGVFTLNVRNDNMSSVTSANGDYSGGIVGPAGETIVAPAPITKWFSAQTSVMYGTSVQAVAAQGASVFTYITGVQVANDSATYSRVKFTGGLGSVLAWTVAPANGGSNIVFKPAIKTGENSGFSASISGVSSVYISAQGFTASI